MKLALFTHGGVRRIGLVERGEVVDLLSGNPRLPNDMVAILEGGAETLEAVRLAAGRANRLALNEVQLNAPITRPRKFLGLGLSFKSSADEFRAKGVAIPEHQVWFNKQVTAINGPYDPVHMPRVSSELDYEGELALVIGKRIRHARTSDAEKVIAGFLVCNDFSVRDWQRRSPTATLGKSFDTHGPIGPWLTTFDEVDPSSLRIRTWVDGELRQDGNTDDLLYTFGEMIAELSTAFTLEPGDILATGSPTGAGQYMRPPTYLKTGQTVRVEIEGLGHIENMIVDEPG